jgi:hypothetical protein
VYKVLVGRPHVKSALRKCIMKIQTGLNWFIISLIGRLWESQ